MLAVSLSVGATLAIFSVIGLVIFSRAYGRIAAEPDESDTRRYNVDSGYLACLNVCNLYRIAKSNKDSRNDQKNYNR